MEMILSDEMGRMWKDAVFICFMLLTD